MNFDLIIANPCTTRRNPKAEQNKPGHFHERAEKVGFVTDQKKMDCKYFAAGNCRSGESCRFKHGGAAASSDDRDDFDAQPSSLCKYFAAGQCRFGSGCLSPHDVQAILTREKEWLKQKDLTRKLCVMEQPFDYYIVFDLEGKEEIIEFPALILDSKTFWY